jgi:Xaa-Pro aminopeptidase
VLVQWRDFNAPRLARFGALQREVFAVLEEVGQTVAVGDTETAVAARIRHALKRLDVRSWFHVPVALFGERTSVLSGNLHSKRSRRKLLILQGKRWWVVQDSNLRPTD